MKKAGGGIELFVGVAEAEFEDEMAGGGVVGMVAGEESRGTELGESKMDDGAGRFFGKAASPEGRFQVNAQLVDARFELTRAEAGATGVFPGF